MDHGQGERKGGDDSQGVSGDGGQGAEQETIEGAPERDSESGSGSNVGKKEGCIYFVETEDGKFMKIGYSATLNRRMGQLEAVLRPTPIRLIGYLPGNRGTETWLHQRFAAHRERGEWFRNEPELREFVAFIGLLRLVEAKPRIGRKNRKIAKVEERNAAAQSLTAMRNMKLSPTRRKEIAKQAANKRWASSSKGITAEQSGQDRVSVNPKES